MADRVVHFASLLSTNRAVKRRGSWVRVHTAGRAPRAYWVEFHSTTDARTCGGSLIVHLREKRARGEIGSDAAYNQIVVDWIAQLDGLGYIKKQHIEDAGSEGEKDDRSERPEIEEAETGAATVETPLA